MPQQEQYTPEKAIEEASRMKQKIKSGEAKTYGEAEKLVESEQVLSVLDIKKNTEDLRIKVEAAKAQREKDVEEKLTDRETLIAEAKTNDELLRATQETLEYFTSMRELGELKDPSDITKLEELETLLVSLEKQRLEIDKKIGLIEDSPKIVEKLYGAAKKEDVEKTITKESEKTREQLDPRIDQLGQSIKSLAEMEYYLWERKEKQEKEISATWKKITDSFTRAKNTLSEKSQFGYVLDEILRQVRTPEEIQQQISEVRKKLGMLFRGKEKAAADFILGRTQEFEEYNRALSEFSSIDKQLTAAKAEETGLVEQYKTIILSSWDAQSKINELTGNSHANDLPLSFSFRLEHIMEKLADIAHWEGDKKVGKFDGWYQANRDSKNRALFDVHENVVKKADGIFLVHHNPGKTKEKE